MCNSRQVRTRLKKRYCVVEGGIVEGVRTPLPGVNAFLRAAIGLPCFVRLSYAVDQLVRFGFVFVKRVSRMFRLM